MRSADIERWPTQDGAARIEKRAAWIKAALDVVGVLSRGYSRDLIEVAHSATKPGELLQPVAVALEVPAIHGIGVSFTVWNRPRRRSTSSMTAE
jgi:hypothetical protein